MMEMIITCMALAGILACFAYYNKLIRQMVMLHSEQCRRILYLSSQISGRLTDFSDYIYDEDVTLGSISEFESFDSCLYLCRQMQRQGSFADKVADFQTAIEENELLHDIYHDCLDAYDYRLSEKDRKEHFRMALPVLWHFHEHRLIRACRPKFCFECTARISWHYGHKKETFLYNFMALQHMAAWCERQDRTQDGNVPDAVPA